MDVTLIIKQMIEKGASEQDIKNSLSDLGVDNVEEVYQKARKDIESQPKAVQNAQQSPTQLQSKPQIQPSAKEPEVSDIEITRITSNGEKNIKLEDIMKEEKIEPESKESLTDSTALLKSIEELNKKILETNREILLKLKLRE